MMRRLHPFPTPFNFVLTLIPFCFSLSTWLSPNYISQQHIQKKTSAFTEAVLDSKQVLSLFTIPVLWPPMYPLQHRFPNAKTPIDLIWAA